MVTMCFLENFEVCIFIFGHFINVQFSKQPINNATEKTIPTLIGFPT